MTAYYIEYMFGMIYNKSYILTLIIYNGNLKSWEMYGCYKKIKVIDKVDFNCALKISWNKSEIY